jgi:hypothetical protein
MNKKILSHPDSFDTILLAVEDFEESEKWVTTKIDGKIEDTRELVNRQLHSPEVITEFINLTNFFRDIEFPSIGTELLKKFTKEELIVLHKISQWFVNSRVGKKWLWEFIDPIKKKAFSLWQNFVNEVDRSFVNGIKMRMLEWDWEPTLRLCEWSGFSAPKLNLVAEYTVIELLTEIFTYDNCVLSNQPAWIREAIEINQRKFDIIKQITQKFNFSEADFGRCKVSAKALMMLHQEKSQ